MKFHKKAAYGTAIGILLLTSCLFAIFNEDNTAKTKALTLKGPELITMKPNNFASTTTILPAPYKTSDVYVSSEISPGFVFTSVGGSWDEIAPEGTHVELEVKFKNGENWSNWIDTEEEEDTFFKNPNPQTIKKYAMASTNSATAIKYRVLFYGDGQKVPIIKNTDWTFIKAGMGEAHLPPVFPPSYPASIDNTSTILPKYAAFTPTYLAENTATQGSTISTSTVTSTPVLPEQQQVQLKAAGDVGVISRAAWGADESYRYMKDNSLTPQLVELDPAWYNKYASELHYSRVVDADEKGNKFKWPLQYPEKVQKIVIHHTASDANLTNSAQAVRDIYYYHAITRAWGDIGYNYLVDQQGNVYEGRYGGESVIGAHSGPGNHGSIGIAMLGDFQTSPVPETAIVKLSQFIYKKTKIHNIQPDENSQFRGKDMPNISGHRDFMSTTCPGQYLYDKLPVVRVLSGQRFDLKPKFVKDYDYEDQSEIYYLELKPGGQTTTVTLKMQNIGKSDWNSQTYLQLTDNIDFNKVISFPEKQDTRLASMQETSVKSGDIATFNFKIKSQSQAKTVYLNLKPIINGGQSQGVVPPGVGGQTPDDAIVIPVSISQPVYKYDIIESKLPPALMKAGTTFNGYMRLKNNGNVPWEQSGDNAIHLTSSYLGITADLQENEIPSGSSGSFNFTFTAPENAGFYNATFTPVMNGVHWISSKDAGFETTVYEREYHAELLSKTTTKSWEQGKNYTISVNLRNIGIKDWDKVNLKGIFVKDPSLDISELTMSPSTISPGQTGTISFTVKLPQDLSPGKQVLLFRPVINGFRIGKMPYYFQYGISEPQLQTQNKDEPKIRVKIGFTGDPEITANGSFDVYSGDALLTTLSAGDSAKVSRENVSSGGVAATGAAVQYRVSAGDTNFLKSNFIRFVPRTNSILLIKNFYHNPNWNTDINDNEYLGVLEVREVDGTLTVINELYLEDYLKGSGEVGNSENMETMKAVLVAARTYAKYYTDIGQKFPGKPYNLDDNPDVSQKYIGYGYQKRAPNVTTGVDATKGKVITHQGKIVKTPYFSSTDGTKTKSAKDVWGWEAPWLISVDDSLCKNTTFAGHGVGLSGCGARAMAEKGAAFEEILKHYYTGVEIMDLY